jgi:hypothetical protein
MTTMLKSGLILMAVAGVTVARGETMLEMPLKAVVEASQLAVHGRVVEAKSRWGDEKRSTIWTDYVVRIEEVLKGNAPGDTVVVTQQGGALEGVVLQVGSNPDLRVRDEVVLMLTRGDFLKGMAHGDNRPKYTIVGVAQGTYYVTRERDKATAFKDYARLAVVPRPDSSRGPQQPPLNDYLKAEVERLRVAVKRNPQDRDLARRLDEAERLLASVPPAPKRKEDQQAKEPQDRSAFERDLGVKPQAPVTESVESPGDAPTDAAEREKALAQAVEAQAAQFKQVVEPVPLAELKQRIRQAAGATSPQ